MIKSILGFIDGTVTEERQTVKTIYLSDGTHWNKHKFHINRSLISSFIVHSVDNNPTIKMLNSIIVKKINEREFLFKNKILDLQKSLSTIETIPTLIEKVAPITEGFF